ncbi:DUF4199 domain-containing protein [Hymenobacter saemangeumensis]
MPQKDTLQSKDLALPSRFRVMLQQAIRYGVGIGILCALWLVGLHLTDNNAFGPKRVLLYFAVPVAVVLSQWSLRRAMPGGKPGLLRALGMGALTTVMAATLVALGVIALGKIAGEPALERNRREMMYLARADRKAMVKQAGSEEGYNRQMAYWAQLSAQDIAQNDFSKILLLGLIFAVPGGIFFRE